MANDNLRSALQEAGLQADDLAQIVAVDVRTVRRWLSGRTPYPRQRGKVACALGTTEHKLWPDVAAASTPPSPAGQPSDLLAAYASAGDLAAPDWKALMRDASDRIELLGDTLTPILNTSGVPELLAAKATGGCKVRVLVSNPGRHLAPLLDQPGIEIRMLEAPARHTIRRFDRQLLVILHLQPEDVDQAPLLHLRYGAPGGLFDRLVQQYSDLWNQEGQPLNRDLAPDYEDGHEGHDPGASDQAAGQAEGVNDDQRRHREWPRRPG